MQNMPYCSSSMNSIKDFTIKNKIKYDIKNYIKNTYEKDEDGIYARVFTNILNKYI